MEIFGKSYDDLTPKQAQEAGVAIIHQRIEHVQALNGNGEHVPWKRSKRWFILK